MLRWWSEGACLIASLRPDLFSKPVKVELQEGSIQGACCCTTIGRPLGQVAADGTFLHKIQSSPDVMLQRWRKARCVAAGAYRITSFEHNPLDKGFFSVQPPVPKGVKAYLLLSCSNPPPALVEADLSKDVTGIDCGNQAALEQWVIFRMLMVTSEVTNEFRKAGIALRLFFQLLKVKYSAELLYEMGIVSAQKGAQLIDSGTRQEAVSAG
jgi:hypothetical protein